MQGQIKRTITIEVTIDLEVEVTLDPVFDDDGCGSPSKTGNSMTGNRGQVGWDVADWTYDHQSAIKAINDDLNSDSAIEAMQEAGKDD